jgi:hypothetical protein
MFLLDESITAERRVFPRGTITVATQATTAADAGRKARKRVPATSFKGGIPIASIGLFATIIGFSPTFFSRLGEVDVVHLMHGWIMTGWILVVLAQALLIRSMRYEWHHRLGWSALGLFLAMVFTSCQVLALMLSGKSRLPFEAAKFFGYSDIVDMPLLVFFFCAAIYWRKDRPLHSRLVAVTVLTSIVPALARMFNILIWRSFEGLFLAMHPTYLLILGVLGVSIYVDWRNQRLRWPLPLAFVWFAFVYATQWPMMNVPAYDALARAIGALG